MKCTATGHAFVEGGGPISVDGDVMEADYSLVVLITLTTLYQTLQPPPKKLLSTFLHNSHLTLPPSLPPSLTSSLPPPSLPPPSLPLPSLPLPSFPPSLYPPSLPPQLTCSFWTAVPPIQTYSGVSQRYSLIS